MNSRNTWALEIMLVIIVGTSTLVYGEDEGVTSENVSAYFEKTKNEILQGRKFSDQSTAVNALLTLISAYHHQDRQILEQIFPIIRQKQFERLASPETRSQMLAIARTSIVCRIEIEDGPPQESDLCAIYSCESPEKPID